MTGASSKRKRTVSEGIYTSEEIRSRRGRGNRVKGVAFERVVAKFFSSIGWYAKKVPGSGGISGFRGDVQAAKSQEEWNKGHKWVIECKRWKAGLTTIRRYLPDGGILIHKSDGEKEIVIMSAATFAEIVSGKGGEK